MLDEDKAVAQDDTQARIAALSPAVHRRILNFLNAAVTAADLEYIRPLFIHDHEGLPVHNHHHGHNHRVGMPERVFDHELAVQILAFRNRDYPLGFRSLKELTYLKLFDLDRMIAGILPHLGDAAWGSWAPFPQLIPRRGPGTIEGVVHAALLHTGSVLFITADETTLLWNPADTTPTSFRNPLNQPHTMPGGYSQLCGHHAFLSDGRLLSVGGGGYGPNPAARWGYKFDPVATTWSRTANEMSDSRWYPTTASLGNRKVLITCGHGSGEMDVYDETTDKFTHVDLAPLPFPSLYPGMHLLPNNKLFYSRTGWGTATAAPGPRLNDDQSAYFTLHGHAGEWHAIAPAPANIADRTKGMSVMLLNPRPPHARIVVFGGMDPATNHTYEVIDASDISESSAWEPRIPFPDGMHRSLCSAVLLPDGKLLLSGGIAGANSPCSIFDPRDNTWARAAELPSQRDYHSVSLLLPSGEVMMAGWNNTTIDIYCPPYLFHGPRPSIHLAPEVIRHRRGFTIETPAADAIRRIVLVRPMAVTHQTDSQQRVLELAFIRDTERADTLFVKGPDAGTQNAQAPAGYYMLFILNALGVPSVAKWIHLDTSLLAVEGATVSGLRPFPGHVDLFTVTPEGTVVSTFFQGESWRPWFSIDDHLMHPRAPVTVLQPFEGHVDLFATDGDGAVMATYFEHDQWQPWFVIHPEDTVHPGAIVTALQPFEGHVDLFATTSDGRVRSTFFEGGNWRTWFDIPCAAELPAGATVSALQPFEGHVDLFIIAKDGTVMSTFFEGDYWREWFGIHAEQKMHGGAEVAVLQPFDGHVDLFDTTGDGRVMSTFFEDGNWRTWFDIPSEVKMHPGAPVTVLQPFEGHVDLFVTAADGTVMSTFFEAGTWRNWFAIQPDVKRMHPGAKVTALLPFEGHVDLFVTDSDGTVWSTFYEAKGEWRPWFSIR
ncbi:MAG: DUF1929 domain-containing protein [Pseudomonadota bacterium]|nr:DUF1929 domain-containing protein [Pseudomonadota bacterium]